MSVDSPVLEGADEILLATGASAYKPSLPGLDLPHVADVLEVHLGTIPVGKRVVVCGGGLSGCDIALDLARQGRQVTIVEMIDTIAANLTYQTRLMLLDELAGAGVAIMTDTTVTSVDAHAVHVSAPGARPASRPTRSSQHSG